MHSSNRVPRPVGQGTGSYPPEWKGWQRNRRAPPIRKPRSTPYFSTAWYVYSEHVGVYRQLGGNAGEIYF